MNDKTFTVAGTSLYKEEYKVRFANCLSRAKVLVKNAHEDVRLVELPNEMTKFEAVMFIKGHERFQDTAAQTAIADYIGEQTTVVDTTTEPKAKAKATKEASPKAKPKAEKKLSKKDELMKRELEALAEARAVAALDAALADEEVVDEDEDAPY